MAKQRITRRQKDVSRIIIIAALLFSAPAVWGEGGAGWQKTDASGTGTVAEENIGSDKGFGAQLLITDDEEYLARWKDPAEPFQLHTVNSALRGQPVFLLILIAGPGVDEKGLCDVTVDIKITRPDGSVSNDTKDSDCWRNMPPPPADNIQLGKTSIGVVIEEKDLAGRYTVEAVVKDRVKDAVVRLSNYFDVT